MEVLRASAAYHVAAVRKSTQNRRPQPPFTTSTLQQEASRRLGFQPKRTMALAQQLYEGRALGAGGDVGLITYMRTDSTQISEDARREARDFIVDRFGQPFLPEKPRVYSKKAKGAQEAHEAIRPTSVRREPQSIRRYLTDDQFRLYQLIWQRLVASQMADAVFDTTSVDIHATADRPRAVYMFRATDSTLRFAGFREVYFERREDGGDDDSDTSRLPPVLPRTKRCGSSEPASGAALHGASSALHRSLAGQGAGGKRHRPPEYIRSNSFHAPGASVRGANQLGRSLASDRARHGGLRHPAQGAFSQRRWTSDFTADMEEDLDEIARGDRPWQPVVHDFYQPPRRVDQQSLRWRPRRSKQTDEKCDKCGSAMVIRWGRFGKFIACSSYPECKNSRPLESAEEAKQPVEEFAVPPARARWSSRPADSAASSPARAIPSAKARARF